MSQESRRLLKWLAGTWIATFALMLGAVGARVAYGSHAANVALIFCLFATLIPGFEIRRGWLGFFIVLTAGISAAATALAVAHFFTTLGFPRDRWVRGLVRAVVVDAMASGVLIFLVKLFGRVYLDEVPPPKPDSAMQLLANSDAIAERSVQAQALNKSQARITSLVLGTVFGITTAFGIQRGTGLARWWLCIPCSVGFVAAGYGSMLLGGLLGRRISRATYRKLEEAEGNVAEVRSQIEQIAAAQEGQGGA